MKQLKISILKSKIKRLEREVSFTSLSKSENALILYNCSDALTEKSVRSFARELIVEGLKVTTIGYFDIKDKNQSKPQDELDYYYFDNSEVSFWGQIKSAKLKRLMIKKFDVLIDLNLKDDFVLRNFSSLSRARFKVGISNHYALEVYDLTVNEKKESIKDVCIQILHYLKMINA